MLRATARNEITAFFDEFQTVYVNVFIAFITLFDGICRFRERGRIENNHAEFSFLFSVFS